MSVTSPGNANAPVKPLHVGLVAGAHTLEDLGPVVGHLAVGLLDEPMYVSLVHPAGADVSRVPSPPVQMFPYPRSLLPFRTPRAAQAVPEALRPVNLALLHALDVGALDVTRHLAADRDLEYLAGVMSKDGTPTVGDERCRGLLAASEPIRQALLRVRGAPPDGIALLRPPVHRAGKATCFIDPNHVPAIVAAGQLSRFEPYAAVLEAFARLRADQRDCAFFLLGSGPSERPLRRLAERLGLMGELTFVDRQSPEQIKGILRAADVFVWPGPSQRVEIELLSAMAAGVPVLAAGAEVSDFIIPDETALAFQTGDADGLAGKLAALLDDRAAARSLAERALALLRRNHSPAAAASRLVHIYRAIAAGKPLPV